ncbi:hypothetical protein ABG768_017683 [Culter alburnus]|uniref:RBR-type E3 ubiquitin transferase n=1 Tax=Culter alburnus TaxID=194366 RepID=A0AAW1YTR6_CULAL
MFEDIKKFTPFDKGIKLGSRPSDLDDTDDNPSVLRAELSCGHVTDPQTLTDCCRAQLNHGQTEFKCPLCKKKWPYDEVQKLAKLTVEEQLSFEEQLGTNTVKKIVDFRDCPGCGSLLERSDVSSLCVQCSVCTVKNGRIFEFCWQCEREWKGPRPRVISVVIDCPMISLPSVVYKGTDVHVQCPAIRACPFCGVLIEHNEGCKMISCPECKTEFCFACLKPTHECLKTSTHLIPCSAGVAPRQIN